MRVRYLILLVAGTLSLAALTMPAAASDWTYTGIYSFNGNGDGSGPNGLISDAKGVLYGATPYGGSFGYGMVFELTPPGNQGGAWTETVLYNFTGGSDGAEPTGRLLLKSGSLYGTNVGGVFKLTPPGQQGGFWTDETLYNFSGGSDGGYAITGVIEVLGELYGTTSFGGNNGCNGNIPGCGVVFQLTPPAQQGAPWTETVLHAFDAHDGFRPSALIADKLGNLYGTASQGGFTGSYLCGALSGCGTVFMLAPPSMKGGAWTTTVLYSFMGGNDGASPQSGLFHKAGALYGAAAIGGGQDGDGGGTIFRLKPPPQGHNAWREATLYVFNGDYGSNPNGALISDSIGALYGTTVSGGLLSQDCNSGCGTVFVLNPPAGKGTVWTETTPYLFSSNGYDNTPNAGLLEHDNAFYGTVPGGAGGQFGAVFQLVP